MASEEREGPSSDKWRLDSFIDESSIMLSQAPRLANALSYSGPQDSEAGGIGIELQSSNIDGANPVNEHWEGVTAKSSLTTSSINESSNMRQRSGYLWRDWWEEVTACVTSVAALLALFATLFVYSNRPSPDWPSWMSLNTIVAIYVAILKTAVLVVATAGIGQLKWSWFHRAVRPLSDLAKYDAATRDPYGACVLLCRLRSKHLLTSAGALIVILCLAADPSAQQIVHYQECPIETAGLAQIPRINFFRTRYPGFTRTRTLFENAMLAGIYAPGGLPPAACPKGNCTWATEYSTIGICSNCEDISQMVTFREQSNKTATTNSSMHGSEYISSIPGISASFPSSGRHIATYASMKGFSGYTYELRSQFNMSVPPGFLNGTYHVDFLLSRSSAGRIDDPMTGMPFRYCNSTFARHLWPCQGYGAARCNITACVKTFSASFDNGVFREQLISASSNWGKYGESEPLAFGLLDTFCLTADEKRELIASGDLPTTHNRWYPWSRSSPGTLHDLPLPKLPLPPDASLSERLLARGCLYATDQYSVYDTLFYVTDFFNGDVKGLSRSPKQLGGMGLDAFTGPQVVRTFFDYGNVTFARVNDMFTNITSSMTNIVRGLGFEGFSEPAVGVVHVTKTCISIQWPWLAYPSALVLLALSFFFLLLWETRGGSPRRGPEIWKSSPLALLYHGLHDSMEGDVDRQSGGDINKMSVMERIAKQTNVQLTEGLGTGTQLEVQHGTSK